MAEAFSAACGGGGLSPRDFWALTPYQTSLIIEGASEQRRQDFRNAAFTGWAAARLGRADKIPDFDVWMGDKDSAPTHKLLDDGEDASGLSPQKALDAKICSIFEPMVRKSNG